MRIWHRELDHTRRHCEERGDEAIQRRVMDRRAALRLLAMTKK
jgi:hypothetical protein